MSRVEPEALRSLASRVPSGVCIVTVDAGGQKMGLTVSSLFTISLDPPLVGFSISRDSAMHELLREAGGCAIGSPRETSGTSDVRRSS